MNCICSLSALVNEMIDIIKDISGKQNFKLKTMNKKNDVLFIEQRKVLHIKIMGRDGILYQNI